jgi:hypothetical protein
MIHKTGDVHISLIYDGKGKPFYEPSKVIFSQSHSCFVAFEFGHSEHSNHESVPEMVKHLFYFGTQ